MIKLPKYQEEKQKGEKKNKFIERYSKALGIENPWTFHISKRSKNIAKMRVIAVNYLLKEYQTWIGGGGYTMQDILQELQNEFNTHKEICGYLSGLGDNHSPLSILGSKVVQYDPNQGCFMINRERAVIWLSFMNELINRDW